MNIAEMILVLQAAERGEEIEMNTGSGWVPMPNAKTDFESHIATWQYRIKPKPRMVPLEPSDVPPGSVFRFIKGDQSGWAAPFQVGKDGVCFTWTTCTRRQDWDTLREEYEISCDGGRTWSKCEKPQSV